MSEQLIQTPGVFGENGNFLLEREIGSGGMGGVYMGRDKMLDRPVAVKVMLKELGSDAEFLEKFKKEAQSVARLIHPNIAQVYSYGICNGMPYIAMELAAGGSLYSIMNANPGKTDIARVVKICQQVAQALQCASDQGFVHGDVKPENILLDSNGNAKLIDFGLAGMQKNTDEIWGTPYYISPEKVRKEPIDLRSDMYSLGGTLYHALTGVAPFEGTDSIAVVKKRFEGLPKKPSEIRPELTPAIDNLVMKMLALDRNDRYPSFESLIEAFKEVLTSGLTAAAKPAAEKAPATPTATGTVKRTTVRGRRVMMTRRSGASTIKRKLDGDEGGDESVKNMAADEEDEEESGGMGAKVLGVILGTILLVGGVIGGLVWYQVADRKAREAEERAQISSGIDKARTAISETIASAKKFAAEYDTFAEKAIAECQKPTDELKRLLPEDQGALLKPGFSKELLDAIASTNEASQVAAPAATNAAPAAATATATNAPPAAIAKLPKFREPTEDEKDPASPEGEAYQKARKAFYEEQAKQQREKSQKGTEEAAAAPVEPEKKPEPTSQAVIAMNELWDRAYACKACAIRIRLAVTKLLKTGESADELRDETRESMEKLAELSRTLVDMFEQVKASKDVETIRKGVSFIKSKGEKLVEQTVKEIRKAKLEAERKARAEEEAQKEKERLAALEAARKAKIEEEVTAAKDKFDAIVTQGCFRQLDWKSATRMLTSLKSEMTTPEGQLACDLGLRKVNDMKLVHDIFIKNLKGHQFRGKLVHCTVESVNEKEIVLYKKGSQGKMRIPWQKFYRDYPGNLNEIINAYIVNARLPSAKNRMSSLLDWANAMTGAALTMRLVCSEVNGAIARSETLVKAILKEFSEYEKTAKEIFPDMTFEDAGSTEEE